ncbi:MULTISPECIES: hypothetical protein [unclassified Pseudomonas]|uniref:hypothetical protein n=1 Tax=unclassified Pseudomonas TaxID=196821 RepID=UPI00244A3035|nr:MULTISPECIES: hypothetical protein [unclassified Pseudomonas]MDG9930436.1 hypothetical protein [Pseudomonas sp. GD04042]MDH0483014.1 hypothetical protein [Pseudomonas sp. GD04015]MDH0605414.1 hypothetical protein [Pseudomonas sp. GD03869]
MATKHDLTDWVIAALGRLGGSASLVEVAHDLWKHHESDLRSSGDLFYTWQYDMRWSANVLRRKGVMKAAEASPHGVWQLAGA